MNEFVRGVLFAAGLIMFGKAMYDLGRCKEQKQIRDQLQVMCNELNDELEKVMQKIESEAE